jgi:hypothetical protein
VPQSPKSKKTQDTPIFTHIATRPAEDPIDNTDITTTNYKSFNNPILKNAARREYIYSTAEGKKEFETAEISAIDSIENIESLTGDELLIVQSNLISEEGNEHYQDVLRTNGLHDRFVNALFDPSNKVDPYRGFYNSYGYYDKGYDAGGGRRNKKRSTKHKKRRGKKTRKYRSK